MSDYPTIKAADIRPGDTIQWGNESYGLKTTFELTVKETWSATGAYIRISNDREVGDTFKADTELALVDRPAPKLPAEPGSVIIAYTVEGEHRPNGLPMIRGWDGELIALNEVGTFYDDAEITDWSPATVTKATP